MSNRKIGNKSVFFPEVWDDDSILGEKERGTKETENRTTYKNKEMGESELERSWK